jgi:hypothetical protein
MRVSAIALVTVLALVPGAAFAQAGPPGGPAPASPGGPPPAAAPPPGAISREQFVERRAEAAGRLFDEIDVNHTGYITRAQLRAWAAQRRGAAAAGPGGPPPQQ